MVGLPFEIGIGVVHVRHVLGDGVVGRAVAQNVQKQPVEVYDHEDQDGDDFEVHRVSSL